MKKKWTPAFLVFFFLSAALALSASCKEEGIASGAAVFVQAYEWGPGVPKVIVFLTRQASVVDASGLTVSTAGVERTVTDVYLSEEDGTKSKASSQYLAIDLETSYGVSGSLFAYDSSTLMNRWADSYPVAVDCEGFTVDGESFPLHLYEDCINSRVCPDTERFSFRDTFAGAYHNPFTGLEEELSLTRAAYEPEGLSGGAKNPLIIWLHGQGEGGTDPDIVLLGNESCALAREEIQSCFTAGEQTGAYVLIPQCGTYWMDEGDGTNGKGSGVSRYTEILMDAITDYVQSHPDVDANRIYIGGCSNGGYMTMNMLIHYPDYFAAAYPICEGYSYYEYRKDSAGSYDPAGVVTDTVWFTDEKIQAVKDLPIWFVLCIADPVIDPKTYELPSYRALLQAGAQNCWLSLFESIEGTDSLGKTYGDHAAWVKLFNNEVTGVQDREAIASSADEVMFGTIPDNGGGGVQKAGAFENLFTWMNAQTKQPENSKGTRQ